MKIYEKEEIYNDHFNENAEEILKKIDEIKAVLAGREMSFSSFIIKDDYINPEMLNAVINELVGYIEERDVSYNLKFEDNKKKFFFDFFYCTLVFCFSSLNKSEWNFESILKLAGTTSKDTATDLSVYDWVLKDMERESLAESEVMNFDKRYKEFNELYEIQYDKDFISDVRHAINTFLELRKISLYTLEDNKEIFRILNFAKKKLKML